MVNKVLYLVLAVCFLSCCDGVSYDSDYTPVSISDGIFAFKWKGHTYKQHIDRMGSCSAYAMCHPNYDTLIISGGVIDSGRNSRPFDRIIFVIPLNEIESKEEVHLKKENVIVEYDHLTQGVYHMDNTTISFNNFIDASYEDQYISGTFVVDGHTKLTDGVFKFWVNKVNHRFGDSSSYYGYNVMFYSE